MLEKAWAKVRGNYMAAEGDSITNGIRALTGHPTFSYLTSDMPPSDLFNHIREAEQAGYIMSIRTGSGGDPHRCGQM